MSRYRAVVSRVALIALKPNGNLHGQRMTPGPICLRFDPDGFITLFNGKDLTGWKGLDDYWSVKDEKTSATHGARRRQRR